MQRLVIEPIEESTSVNRREDLDLQEGRVGREPRQVKPEENAPVDQEDHNVAPFQFNDFEDQLHPRYHDKAKTLINLFEKHSTLIAVIHHSQEDILDCRNLSIHPFMIYSKHYM